MRAACSGLAPGPAPYVKLPLMKTVCGLLLICFGVFAQDDAPSGARAVPAAPTLPPREQARSMIVTKYGIVAASQFLASQTGARILEAGGNAIDAAAGRRRPRHQEFREPRRNCADDRLDSASLSAGRGGALHLPRAGRQRQWRGAGTRHRPEKRRKAGRRPGSGPRQRDAVRRRRNRTRLHAGPDPLGQGLRHRGGAGADRGAVRADEGRARCSPARAPKIPPRGAFWRNAASPMWIRGWTCSRRAAACTAATGSSSAASAGPRAVSAAACQRWRIRRPIRWRRPSP